MSSIVPAPKLTPSAGMPCLITSSHTFDGYNATRQTRPQHQGQPAPSRYYDVIQSGISNITLIDLRNSDGDALRRPQRTARAVDEDGNVNYLEEAREEIEKHWRKVIGGFLAKSVLTDQGWNVEHGKCILKRLPSGYKLYTHKKGDKDVPRMDAYLYGGPQVFRSPDEFCLHARWLALGSPTRHNNNKPECPCKYCDGRYGQNELNKRWGIIPARKRRGPRKTDNKPKTDWANVLTHVKDYTKLNTSTQTPSVASPSALSPSSPSTLAPSPSSSLSSSQYPPVTFP
ncbi:hypothetical protein NEOLEDRAFT_1177321 [Neolentinus lepideus HHB14362 ss-1]|uniref:Cryptic loci regulator 2 N-terminal domain-containing protein n=1 Tax=Neolentinus lepideus HHB14362 ss-1 TaxID=1314782 RepID=A0A165TIV3_9AGAM|nr:hypothetical protein NEOLEDRAFT_1177321 [Neolentinus lepideus HHB14362 ss-1]